MSVNIIELNPDLDLEPYAETFARDGMVRIPNVFPADVADKIATILEKATPWRIVYADETGKHVYHTVDEWRDLGAQKQAEISRRVTLQAKENFSYIYNCYPLIDAYLAGWDKDWPLHAMTEFLNSSSYLDLGRRISGADSIIKADGQATLYLPGHFLTEHNDTGDNMERRAAYVMSFTRRWRPDWGGQLLFIDDSGNVTRGFTPEFNSLTMFSVPQTHYVTQVASYAGAGRFSITGWFRDDPKDT